MSTETKTEPDKAALPRPPASGTPSMRAIVQDAYGSSGALRLARVDRPQPRDDEVLVRVHAAAVDRGTWHLMTGLPYLVRLAYGLRRPRARVPGTDFAGQVEAVGRKVSGVTVGDPVFGTCRGAFGEYACAKAGEIAGKPASLSFEEGAALPVSGLTALQGLRDVAGLGAGGHVLVLGASGGVGTFAVQIAKALGARVTGVCSTAKMDAVRALGADAVLDYTKDEIARTGTRYDVIFDVGGNRPLSDLRRALAADGTLVIVGGEGGGKWIGGTDRQVRALLISPFVRQRLRTFVSKTRSQDLQTLSQLVEEGRLTALVDRTYPLDRVPEAVDDLEGGRVTGKAVITV